MGLECAHTQEEASNRQAKHKQQASNRQATDKQQTSSTRASTRRQHGKGQKELAKKMAKRCFRWQTLWANQ
jgi:hypothetical protein